jgi:hypothetical protein
MERFAAPTVMVAAIVALVVGLAVWGGTRSSSSGGSQIQLEMSLGPQDPPVLQSVGMQWSIQQTNEPAPKSTWATLSSWAPSRWFTTALPPTNKGPRRIKTLAVTATGNSDNDDFSAFNMLIFDVQICEDLTPTSATAFSDPVNAFTVYNSSLSATTGPFAFDVGSLNSTQLLTAAQQGAGNFSNVMSGAVRYGFSTDPADLTVTEGPGRYQFGIMNIYPLVSINGEITLNDDSTILRTANGSFFGSGNTWFAGSLNTGPKTLSYVQTGTGGLWSRMIGPTNGYTAINATQVRHGTGYKLSVILNTQFYFKGINDRTDCDECNIVESAPDGNGLAVPVLDITMILHTQEENVVCETYQGTPNVASDNKFTILVQIYYIAQDSTFAIRGIHAGTLYEPSSDAFVMTFPRLQYVVNETPDSPVTRFSRNDFYVWDNSYPAIEGFQRTSGPGGVRNATINCVDGYFTTPSCTDGTSFNASFTFVSKSFLAP